MNFKAFSLTAKIVILFALLMLNGCAKNEPADNRVEPLTKEEWSVMDPKQKFEKQTLKRLQETEPELKDKQMWQKFLVDEFAPQKSTNK